MPDNRKTALFNASYARNVAETLWGRSNLSFKTKRLATNRKGAFFFDCSGASGFIIDARCLTTKEQDDIEQYSAPDGAHEYFDDANRLQLRTNPYTSQYNRKPAHRPKSEWRIVPIEVYAFRTGLDACLPVIYANITTEIHAIEEALQQFQMKFDATAHQMIELHAALAARAA